MAKGDWAAGSRLIWDSVTLLYNDEAAPPTLATVIAAYRIQLPSGGTAPRTFTYTVPAGTTSKNFAATLQTFIAALQASEGVTP